MIGLFLGAGFSKWAINMPLASQLFDFKVDPFGVRDKSKLELVADLKKSWDVKNPNGLVEEFIAFAKSLGEKQRKTVFWYITRRLSEPFIWREFHAQRRRQHVLMIDENRKFKIEGVCKAQQFIKYFLPNLNSIITTNYDLLIEYALGTKNFNYGTVGQILHGRGPYPISQWIKPVRLKGNIPVAKIHGSISWDNDHFYSDGRRGITGNALIIAPTPEKEPPTSLQAQWDLASKILRRTKHLIVFGFAFNPYDEAVLNHLKEYGQNIESVLLIDISPNIEGCKYCWPKAEILTTKPPPEDSKFILKMYHNWII